MLTARARPASSLGRCRGRNKVQGKLCAAHHPVLELDGRTMQLGDTLHDRQSEPGAALAVSVAPPEAAEDQLALLVRNAGPAILHRHRAVILDNEFHNRILWRVAD